MLLGTGTLYGAIKRLLERGWIRRVNDPIPNGTDRVRKAYVLTELRRRLLNTETERLRNLVNVALIQSVGEST